MYGNSIVSDVFFSCSTCYIVKCVLIFFFFCINKTQQTKEWKIRQKHDKITTSNEYAIYSAHKIVYV